MTPLAQHHGHGGISLEVLWRSAGMWIVATDTIQIASGAARIRLACKGMIFIGKTADNVVFFTDRAVTFLAEFPVNDNAGLWHVQSFPGEKGRQVANQSVSCRESQGIFNLLS